MGKIKGKGQLWRRGWSQVSPYNSEKKSVCVSKKAKLSE